MDMDRKKAIEEVMAADFSAYDLALYLDTHPYDLRALALYRNLAYRAKMLTENYERMHGPLTARSSGGYNSWVWAQTPWPWEDQ